MQIALIELRRAKKRNGVQSKKQQCDFNSVSEFLLEIGQNKYLVDPNDLKKMQLISNRTFVFTACLVALRIYMPAA